MIRNDLLQLSVTTYSRLVTNSRINVLSHCFHWTYNVLGLSPNLNSQTDAEVAISFLAGLYCWVSVVSCFETDNFSVVYSVPSSSHGWPCCTHFTASNVSLSFFLCHCHISVLICVDKPAGNIIACPRNVNVWQRDWNKTPVHLVSVVCFLVLCLPLTTVLFLLCMYLYIHPSSEDLSSYLSI